MDKVTFETKLRFTCDGETIVTTYANLSLHQPPACHSRSRSSFAGNLASEPDRPRFLMNSELIEIAEYFRKMRRLAFPVATIKFAVTRTTTGICCFCWNNWEPTESQWEPLGPWQMLRLIKANKNEYCGLKLPLKYHKQMFLFSQAFFFYFRGHLAHLMAYFVR